MSPAGTADRAAPKAAADSTARTIRFRASFIPDAMRRRKKAARPVYSDGQPLQENSV
jgi:hypothetical protein